MRGLGEPIAQQRLTGEDQSEGALAIEVVGGEQAQVFEGGVGQEMRFIDEQDRALGDGAQRPDERRGGFALEASRTQAEGDADRCEQAEGAEGGQGDGDDLVTGGIQRASEEGRRGGLAAAAVGADLGLELLLERPVEALDEPAGLGLVGLAARQADAECAAGCTEPIRLVGRAAVDVQADRQTVQGDEPAKAEAQGDVVLVQVVAALGDVAAEVVDEAAVQRAAFLVVRTDADPGSVVEVADDQLEPRRGFDTAEGLAADREQGATGETDVIEVPLEGRAGDVLPPDPLGANEDVDDRLGRAVRLLAPQAGSCIEDVGRDGAHGAAVLAGRRAQGQQTASTVLGQPGPERAQAEAALGAGDVVVEAGRRGPQGRRDTVLGRRRRPPPAPPRGRRPRTRVSRSGGTDRVDQDACDSSAQAVHPYRASGATGWEVG